MSRSQPDGLTDAHRRLLLRIFFGCGEFKADVTTDSALLLDLRDAGLVVTVGKRKAAMRWIKLSKNLDVMLPRSAKSSRRVKYDVTDDGAKAACDFIASLRVGFVARVSALMEFRGRRG